MYILRNLNICLILLTDIGETPKTILSIRLNLSKVLSIIELSPHPLVLYNNCVVISDTTLYNNLKVRHLSPYKNF